VAVVAVFVLRAKQPDAERPFRAWGYPIAPGIYAVASALILINALVTAPNQTGWGAFIIALGVPIYFLFTRRSRN
jgi:APA family basic amino acid/polyamine antiporter